MKELAGPAIAAAEQGKVRFTPERWKDVYLDWLRNIRDWCVSRQLWWGHRIPVWTCEQGHVHASVTDLERCPTCGKACEQDPDVLDTWFSSAMWPFATLGWPDSTPEFAYYYPTQVLSTARDILYLWVARMVFMSLEFVHEIPFHDVLIHATILDAKGQRMSKSKGTGVDPLDIMAQFGTDACRFWFAGAGTSAQDVRYTEDKIESGRNFANKLWNASRFALMNLSAGDQAEPTDLELADRWILSRLERTIDTVTTALETFHLSDATSALYDFVWSEFCDWYLELAKPRMRAGDPTVRAVLRTVLYAVVRLLHPFMPFITEEIHAHLVAQRLVPEAETLLRTSWPARTPSRLDEEAEGRMGLVMDVIRTVRAMRSELGVPAAKKAELLYIHASEAQAPILRAMAGAIALLTRSETIEVSLSPREFPQAASGVAGENTLLLPLAGLLDIRKEIDRLTKEEGSLGNELSRIAGQLSNDAFVAKAPAAVVDKLRARQSEVTQQIETVRAQLARWKA
jgi:valyl-tRNA synthetase